MPDPISPQKQDYFFPPVQAEPEKDPILPVESPAPTPPPQSPLPPLPPREPFNVPIKNVETPPLPVAPPIKKKKSPLLIVFAVLIGLLILGGVGLLLSKIKIGGISKKGQVTLTYWGLFEPQSVIQQVISQYEESHPGIKINYSQQNLVQYRERLQERLTSASQPANKKDKEVSAETPDIFRIHQSWVPMFKGLLSEMPATVYDITTFEKTFYPSAKDSLKVQGKYYAVPLMFDGLALFCNEDLFKAKGIDLPQNWSELKEAAKQLTTRDSEGKITTAGVALGSTVNVDHWSDILGLMLLQSGVDLSNPGNCTVGGDGANVCPGADALQFFANFLSVDRVWNSNLPTSTYSFAKGDLAMYFGPSWRVFDIEAIKGRLQGNFSYKIIPVPQLPSEGGEKISWSSYWVEAVSQKSANQEQAWEFLKYLSSKEVMQKLYQTQSAVRSFGEPFSRIDMAEMISQDHPYASAYLLQAPYAKNWFLSSSTSDSGINDKIIDYFKNAVNDVSGGGDPVSALNTASKGVVQILSQYGVTK